MAAIEGEVVSAGALAPALRPAERPGEIRYQVYAVDLPHGGRLEGLGLDAALHIADRLGTRAYRAEAVLVTKGPRTGLVVVAPLERIERPRAQVPQEAQEGHGLGTLGWRDDR